MTQVEIANLNHAGQLQSSRLLAGLDGRMHVAALLAATVPAFGIIAVAFALLTKVI